MRIGLFTDAYYPIISGVTISVDILRTELLKLGHEVIVVTYEHDDAVDSKGIIRLKGRKPPIKVMGEYRIGKVTKKKIDKIKELNLDIIHCHTEFTIGRLGRKAAKELNIPVVHTYHTMYEDYIHFISKIFSGPLKFTAKKYSKSFADSADSVIFPTIKVKNAFDGYGFLKDSSIVPTGIYLEKFRRNNFSNKDLEALKKDLNINKDDLVMLFLGRMSREKGIDDLLDNCKDICSTNDNIKLLLVGDGPDFDYFYKKTKNLGFNDKVIFTGMVAPKDVGIYYHIADLFVNFSITETQGLTYIEALASGLPLLVKYDDNLQGVIKDGVNGFSFTNNSDFVSLFNKLSKDKLLLEEFACNTYNDIQRFSSENFAKKVLKVYDDLLKK